MVEDFNQSGSSWTPDRANGGALTFASGTYTYTARDGTVAVFKTLYTGSVQMYGYDRAYLETVTAPNGLVTRYHYSVMQFQEVYPCMGPEGFLELCEGDPVGPIYRLQSVTTNTGYQLHFEYNLASAWQQAHVAGWLQLDHVRAVNNAVDFCDPLANTCTFSRDWPRIDLARTSNTIRQLLVY